MTPLPLLLAAVTSLNATSPVVIDVGPARSLKTVEAAFAQVEALRRTDTVTPVRVCFDAGKYPAADTFRVTPSVARCGWGMLTLSAHDPSARPEFLGGRPIPAWRKEGFRGRTDVWTTDVSASVGMRLLFYDGRRMDVARVPEEDPAAPLTSGYFQTAIGATNEVFGWSDEIPMRPEDDGKWADPQSGWVVVFPRHNWWNRCYFVRGCATGRLLLDLPHEVSKGVNVWERWRLENVAEALVRPGRWYFDKTNGKIRIIPPKGDDPNSHCVIAPHGGAVFQVMPGAGNVAFERLTVTCAQEGLNIGNARGVSVRGCTLRTIGHYEGNGVSVRESSDISISDCDIFDIGSNGVSVHPAYGFQAESVGARANITVANNYIHHCGRVNSHGIGVVYGGQGVTVTHNLFHDLPRCAVYGYGRHCEISYNRIRHVNLINDDTGAIYGAGWTDGTGTKVCYNHVTQSIGYRPNSDGTHRFYSNACGIYADESSGGLSVYGNFVQGCHMAAMHLHSGRWITVSNNVFVSNGALPTNTETFQFSITTWDSNPEGYFMSQRRDALARGRRRVVEIDPRWKEYPSLAQAPDDATTFNPNGTTVKGVKVCRNIFYYPDQGEGMCVTAHRLDAQSNAFDSNVYWPGKMRKVRMRFRSWKGPGDGWEDWRVSGQDDHSVVADPRFRNPEQADWRLKPGSPAFRFGFVDLPYDRMGLEKTEFRPILPVEAEGAREHPEWFRRNKEM